MHGIKPSELADPGYILPKIPKKENVPLQVSMAEIIEESDQISAIKNHGAEELQESGQNQTLETPDFNLENIKKSFAIFAEKQKVSLISLIKLLIPELDEKEIIITLTRQQEEYIGNLKIEWQAWLRDWFSDPSITLQIKIDDSAHTARKAYTPKEQFDELMAENEHFRKMVRLFNLKNI